MPSRKREREVARQRYERQQVRRVEAKARARRRQAIIGSVLAVALVIGGVSALAALVGGDDSAADSAASPSPSASPSASPSTSPSASPSPTPTGNVVSCNYRKVPAGGGRSVKQVAMPPRKFDRRVGYTATIATNRGPISMKLLAHDAPCTVNSFVHLARAGFFNSSTCHRLLTGQDSILQCGDPFGTGLGGPSYQFDDENLARAGYPAGTVAMANSGPNTNGSQFFLVYSASIFPPNYTPFGKITKGIGVLEAIGKAGADPSQKPKAKVVVRTVKITAAK